jgi:hypothetical protein
MQGKETPRKHSTINFKELAVALIVSIILVGIMTKFKFGTVLFAHDPFFQIHSVKAVIYLALILGSVGGAFHHISKGLARTPVFAMVFAMIVPVVSLFCVYLFYGRMMIDHPEEAVIAQNQMWILGILIAALTVMEVKIFLSIRDFLSGKQTSK